MHQKSMWWWGGNIFIDVWKMEHCLNIDLDPYMDILKKNILYIHTFF